MSLGQVDDLEASVERMAEHNLGADQDSTSRSEESRNVNATYQFRVYDSKSEGNGKVNATYQFRV